MKLNDLSINDKRIFCKYLGLKPHSLSVYSFTNIYIWNKLFDIKWAIVDEGLCVFFKDNIGCFLYLPPLARNMSRYAIKTVFEIMDSFNKNREISRIENIEENDADFYKSLGLDLRVKSYDYVCERTDLAGLKGNSFKHKRASLNYFLKHNQFDDLEFCLKDGAGCLKLYKLWMGQRKSVAQDPVYLGMMNDSFKSFKVLLENYRHFGIMGRVVKINKEIKAFSFGFKLNPDTFCILYEITDLSVKGLAQFIFQRFCSQVTDCRYINIMDDSGLANLKKVKLSYRPVRLIPGFIAKRNDA